MGRHERIAELVHLDRPGLEVADLGAGQGRTVRAMLHAATPPARVHAVDAASGLDDEVLHDARVRSLLADLDEPLPFADASLDRAVSLNVAEHLADPTRHLAECYRVLRPGGLLVLAHSDWDTALFASPDDALTRLLVDRFVSTVPRHAERADGFMGRKLLGLATRSEFELVSADTWADCHRRFDQGSVSWKIAMGVLAATKDDPELSARATTWVEGLGQLAAEGKFLFAVTDVALVLRRPAS
ncbi:methyltransferase domain-containing protein [Kineosporia sp. J2-2]|uniref:Methyltransferase domain-containing protein n=1 Tax=Kineosporia corallincola TaxID=2835133 RepID=A0ABS5T9G5_9ACTN|nr:methyltransferase domain-containing protein [Kineosporia corallincola]MBT0767712.1 methyltransferase domain-containing protein [Kineosporia corallincola]